ncbi:MAG: YceI family protein [Bacteroidetes bacterium]|nr:YceI family protein [Bacteroidota bacterium]NCQ10988.1 YceI family protein [Bacteroidota bacterium]
MVLKIKSLLFVLLFFPYFVTAQEFETKTGMIEFLSEATVESFTGSSNQLNGYINLSDSTLDFYLDLATLETGVKLRDEHMRENHLETEKFPYAEFSGKMRGFDTAIADSQQVFANGTFTIHGVSKEIEVEGKAILVDGKFGLSATWNIILQDYEITRPKFLFLKLSESQIVTLKAALTKK